MGGSGDKLQSFLTLTLDGREQSYSLPTALFREKSPMSHGLEGPGGSIAGFDTLEKRISFGENRVKF